MTLGKVVLVGAGPGDPGLLTLKGKMFLGQADVVVYDRLVGAGVLSSASPHAKIIDVGKTPGCHPIPQEEINRILLEEAQKGRLVIRLKGGDPFLFGRGGEELEFLERNGIPFEVVPGVTSSLAAPAYAGIPVTHRDCASSLHIITAHEKEPGRQPDYSSLARLEGTLIFLMGVSALTQICNSLISAGMPPHTPAAIIENGSSSCQRQIVSTLGQLPSQAQNADIRSPAVIIVGKVCAMATSLHWADLRPLDQIKVVVTRPQKQAAKLCHALSLLGAEVVEYPCICTAERPLTPALQQAVARAVSSNWVVFTSANGVTAFLNALRQLKIDIRNLADCKIAAIGCATASVLEERGLFVDLLPQEYSCAALSQELLTRLTPEDRVSIPRAGKGNQILTGQLAGAHIKFEEIPLYDTSFVTDHPIPAARLTDGKSPCFVLLTSASTVKGFVASIGEQLPLSAFHAICIGSQTALQAQKFGISYTIAASATTDCVIKCLCDLVSKRKEKMNL